jgi:hypothetical protein
MLFDTTWNIQRELLIKKARFTLKPYDGPTSVPLRLRWITNGLPDSAQPKKQGDNYFIELTDVPPLPEEKYAPPVEWSQMSVRFIYSSDDDITKTPDEYWRLKSSKWGEWADEFTGKHKLVEQEVTKLAQPGDTPEQMLRKFYARAQQIHNTTYDRDKTEKEAKHDKTKDNNNVDDVLKRGYGSAYDVNMLFLSMARVAGFDAHYVWAAPRDRRIFNKTITETRQLSDPLVMVKAGNKEYFLDPGTLYCPFGLLSWEETGVMGLTAAKGGGVFVQTPAPRSLDAVTVRDAALKFGDGRLDGTVKVTFNGLEALRWRTSERDDDEATKRKDLEDELAGWLPGGATIELTKVTGWTSTDEPLVAEFKVSVIGAVTATGKRLLLNTGLFHGNDQHPLQHADRQLPVYFPYPFRELDDITIQLPPGFKIEGAPPMKDERAAFGAYQRVTDFAGDKVHVQRLFVMDGIIFRNEYYRDLRSFYDTVRASDGDTLVLKGAAQ